MFSNGGLGRSNTVALGHAHCRSLLSFPIFAEALQSGLRTATTSNSAFLKKMRLTLSPG